MVLLSSCSKDDEVTIDVRDFVEGTYDYDADITVAGEIFAETGEIIISKHTNEKAIEIMIDGDVFIGSKVTGDDTAVLFDIEPKEMIDAEGDGYEMRGVPAYTYQGIRYHGIYEAARQTLTISAQTDYVNNDFDAYNAVMIIVASKQ